MANLMLLDHVLKRLKLPTVGKQYRSVAREAEERNLSYEAFLLALVEQEICTREENQRQRTLRQAAFPMPKTLDTFEFHLVPALNKNRVLTLSQGDFAQKQENILLLGNSGTGKTHIAIAIGMQLIGLGYRVRFITAADLVEELLLAKDQHRLSAFEKQWLKYDVVICDELGYVPFTRAGAELLFQFFSTRYERASTILTSNLEFTDWLGLFGDEKLTAALLDRLTHKAHILLMNGESYRFRQASQQRKEHGHEEA